MAIHVLEREGLVNLPLISTLFNGHPGTSLSGAFSHLSAAMDETQFSLSRLGEAYCANRPSSFHYRYAGPGTALTDPISMSTRPHDLMESSTFVRKPNFFE